MINKETYAIADNSYHKVIKKKTQIIIGNSLRKKSNHIIRLQNQEFGLTTKWNTFTITRKGEIYQHYDYKYYSDFLGIEKADLKSISIVLENMGFLIENHEGKYVNWLNEICDKRLVGEKKWLGYHFWEKYQKKQITSLVDLCKYLCKENDMPLKSIDFDYYHKDIINYNGIVFRSNYIDDSTDINPMFNIIEFNELLNK